MRTIDINEEISVEELMKEIKREIKMSKIYLGLIKHDIDRLEKEKENKNEDK